MTLPLAALLLCAAPLTADDPPAAVQGRVVDAQTGEPIAKAVVAVRDRQRETVDRRAPAASGSPTFPPATSRSS